MWESPGCLQWVCWVGAIPWGVSSLKSGMLLLIQQEFIKATDLKNATDLYIVFSCDASKKPCCQQGNQQLGQCKGGGFSAGPCSWPWGSPAVLSPGLHAAHSFLQRHTLCMYFYRCVIAHLDRYSKKIKPISKIPERSPRKTALAQRASQHMHNQKL